VERTPEEFHEAAKKVVERGYRALKLDPFGPGHYELEYEEKMQAVSLVEAVRDAIGPEVEILLEMHGRFSPATAIEMARMLQPFGLGWVEEPVPPVNLKALKKASDGIEATVATGERIHQRLEYREVFELQAADVIQPDISHIGGLLETKKLASWADAYYVTIAPHNVGGQINTAAALHLAACTTNFRIQEYFNDFADPWVRETAPGLSKVTDGYFELPEGPGLGVELDEEVIEAHPKQNVHFNLFAEGWERREGAGTGANQ
jgi:galactonate dehydratase